MERCKGNHSTSQPPHSSQTTRGIRIWFSQDLQEEALKTVLAQAELLCAEWV